MKIRNGPQDRENAAMTDRQLKQYIGGNGGASDVSPHQPRNTEDADLDAEVSGGDSQTTSDADNSRDPFEVIADQFMERCRRGETPSIEAYVSQHPEHADEIRELFPTIVAMERLKSTKERRSGERVLSVPDGLERLGDLKIIAEIGRGGMGIVYEAEQESLGRRVAVKVLPKQFLLDEKRLRRFRREARTAANLHHTNIVPILGVGEYDGYHYYVMQYIRGVGLDEVVSRIAGRGVHSRSGHASSERASEVTRVARAFLSDNFEPHQSPSSSTGSHGVTQAFVAKSTETNSAPPQQAEPSSGNCTSSSIDLEEYYPPETASTSSTPTTTGGARQKPELGAKYWRSVAQVGFQVADALHYAHEQNVLHRDIKPANLLLDSHGVVWVADFGLAKAMEQDDVSLSGDIVGTLRYMAPEQAQGETDARSVPPTTTPRGSSRCSAKIL
jgi:tRNA A-37 threonylcarbamoyl transferase component Bud32